MLGLRNRDRYAFDKEDQSGQGYQREMLFRGKLAVNQNRRTTSQTCILLSNAIRLLIKSLS